MPKLTSFRNDKEKAINKTQNLYKLFYLLMIRFIYLVAEVLVLQAQRAIYESVGWSVRRAVSVGRSIGLS